MKKLNGKIVRSVGFMTGLVLILTLSSMIFSPKREAYNIIAVDAKEQSINAEPENTLDVIFMGDSEIFWLFSFADMGRVWEYFLCMRNNCAEIV